MKAKIQYHFQIEFVRSYKYFFDKTMGNCSGVCANSGVDPTIVNKKGNCEEEIKQIDECL